MVGLDRLRPNDLPDPAGRVSEGISRGVRGVRDGARNDARQVFRDFLVLGLAPVALGVFGVFAGIGAGSALLMGLATLVPIAGVAAMGAISARRHVDLVDEEIEHDKAVHRSIVRSTGRVAKRILAAYGALSSVRTHTDDHIDGMTRAHEKQARLRLYVVGAALAMSLAGAGLPVALAAFGVVSAPLLPTAMTFMALYSTVQLPLTRAISGVARVREAMRHLANAEWDLFTRDPLGMASNEVERTVTRSVESGDRATVLRLVNVGFSPSAKMAAELGSHVPPSFELEEVNLALRLDEPHVIAVVGHVGSGKSTIGRIVAGVESATSGEVVFEDAQGVPLRESQWPVTGFVPAGEAFPFSTIRSALVAADPSLGNLDPKQLSRRISDSLFRRVTPHLTGLFDEDPSVLSSGQRMALWHTMSELKKAKLMVVDEPFSNLDVEVRAEVVRTVQSAAKRSSMLIITHALAEPIALGCEVVLVGRRSEAGPSTVLERWSDASRAPFGSMYVRQTCRQLYDQVRHLQPRSTVPLVDAVDRALGERQYDSSLFREPQIPVVDEDLPSPVSLSQQLDREGSRLRGHGAALDPSSSTYFQDALTTWQAIFDIEETLGRLQGGGQNRVRTTVDPRWNVEI